MTDKTQTEIYDDWTVKTAPRATAYYNELGKAGILTKDPLFFIKRSMTVGGSDIGAILGLNKYTSAVDLFNQKTMRSEPFGGSFDTRLGTYLEPFIYEELPHVIKGAKLLGDRNIVDIQHPWRTAQLDNTAYIPQWDCVVNIECKKFSPGKDWGRGSVITDAGEIAVDGEDDLVPASYFCQCVWGQTVGLFENKDNPKITLLLAFAPFERQIRVYVIRFDKSLALTMLKAADSFVFNHLIPDVYPAMSVSERADELKTSKSKPNGEVWLDGAAVVAERCSLIEQRDALQERIDAIDADIKVHCGENEAVYDANNTLLATWKTSTRHTVDTKKLKTRYPDAYNECLKETTSRIFKVK